MNLLIVKAGTFLDFLYIRNLRNSVRFLLTGSTRKISLIEQIYFFLNKPQHIDLYIVKLYNKKIGYLLIRKSNNKNFITEVIEEKYRGLGIGSYLIEFAKNKYQNLEAQIFLNNYSSRRLHEKNNFLLIRKEKGIAHYQLRSD